MPGVIQPSHWSAAVKNVLAVVLIVSVAILIKQAVAQEAGLEIGPDLVVAPESSIKTQRWEYKVAERPAMNPDIAEKRLNEMAKEGWELSQIDQREGLYIFRRPVRDLPGQAALEKLFEAERLRAEIEFGVLLGR